MACAALYAKGRASVTLSQPRAAGESAPFEPGDLPVPAPFDDIEIGQVVSLGEVRIDSRALDAFIEAFAPGWPPERGAPDAMVYAIWTRLDAASVVGWPQTKRLGVDALRWA